MTNALSAAIDRLLRPLVRVLLRNGVPFNAFAERAKRACVDLAMQQFGLAGKKHTVSRTSVLTGLSRKEVLRVPRLRSLLDAGAAERYNRAARVIAGRVCEHARALLERLGPWLSAHDRDMKSTVKDVCVPASGFISCKKGCQRRSEMNSAHFSRIVTSLVTLLAVAACGGGDGGINLSSGGTGGTGVSAGVMTKGSIVVNGVHFDDSQASIRIDDTIGTPDDLQDGMVVKVKGRFNADGVTGIAQQVEAEDELQGIVQSVSATTAPQWFQVLGQRILVDDLTIYAGPALANFASIAPDTGVKVHGLRDPSGAIRASRVESAAGVGTTAEIELKGTVSNKGPTTFEIGGLEITYDTTIIDPIGATLSNGDRVEVQLSSAVDNAGGPFTAIRIEREDLEDADFDPAEGDEFDLQGFVSNFAAHPGTFRVDSQAVRTTSSTRFENGSPLDLADRVEIEAEGNFIAGTLVAEKISFRRTRIDILTTVNDKDPTGRTVTVFRPATGPGKMIRITDLTEIKAITEVGVSFSDIAIGDRVEIDAYEDSSGNLIAERIEERSPGGDDALQARVTIKDPIAGTLVLLGIKVDTFTTTVFRDTNDNPIDQDAFFAAITPASGTPPGTLIEVSGTYDPSANSGNGEFRVAEAELED